MFIEVQVPAGVQSTVIEFCIWDLALATAPVTFTLFACAIWRKCDTLWETLNTSKDQIEKLRQKANSAAYNNNIENKTTLEREKDVTRNAERVTLFCPRELPALEMSRSTLLGCCDVALVKAPASLTLSLEHT